MLLALKIFVSLAFVLSGGVLFSKWAKQHRVLVGISAIVGLIGSYYLGQSIYADLKTLIGNGQSNELQTSPSTSPPPQPTLTNPKGPSPQPPTSKPDVVQIGQLVENFGPNEFITALKVSPIVSLVAIISSPSSSKDELSIWDYRSGERIHLLAENLQYVRELHWSSDGRSILVREQQRILEFHLPSKQRRILMRNLYDLTFIQQDINGLSWVGLPYPKKYPLAEGESEFRRLEDKYQLDNFGYFKPFEARKRSSSSLSLSPEEIRESRNARNREQTFRSMTTACSQPIGNLSSRQKSETSVLYDNKSFCIWDTRTGTPIRAVGHDSPGQIRTAAMSQDGATLALGMESGDIEVWDAVNWKRLRTLSGHNDDITSLNFSPAGDKLVSSGDVSDGKVIVWDLLRGSQIASYVGNNNGGVGHVDFAQNGRSVLSTTYGVRNWKLPR